MGSNRKVNRRILVLGSAPHTRMVTAYTWDNLPNWLKSDIKPIAQTRFHRPIAFELQLSQEIGRLKAELDTAQQQLQVEMRFRKLLYEQGEDALEPVVREALQELGAQITPPQQHGHEDGRLTDPSGRNGMLEMKGRTKSLKLADVRQLDQWVRDAIATENWQGKGILIANTYCGDPLEQRSEPFPENCINAA